MPLVRLNIRVSLRLARLLARVRFRGAHGFGGTAGVTSIFRHDRTRRETLVYQRVCVPQGRVPTRAVRLLLCRLLALGFLGHLASTTSLRGEAHVFKLLLDFQSRLFQLLIAVLLFYK